MAAGPDPKQFVKAVTSTVEYRIPYSWTNTTLRLEHRWDESALERAGDFFVAARCNPACLADAQSAPGALLWTFDSL